MISTPERGACRYRFIEDGDKNVFHKAMAYGDEILTLGGTEAVVKLKATISGAHRLPNGNAMICSGPQGRFFEVTPKGEIV